MAGNPKKNTNAFSPEKEPNIKYQPSNLGWGLSALYEAQMLTFSASFEASEIRKKKISTILRLLIGKPQQQKNNIIAEIDIYQAFSEDAKQVWLEAYRLAKKNQDSVGAEAILLALLKQAEIQNLFARIKVSSHMAEGFLKNYLLLNTPHSEPFVKKIPFEAFFLATRLHTGKIDSLMLLGALIKLAPKDNIVQAIFINIGLTAEKLELLSVWLLGLDYEYPENSKNYKLLYCCRQAKALEEHFKYFYDFHAIEAAVRLSSGQTLKDLEHKKALQLLVKAGLLAKNKGQKNITESLVEQEAEVN